MCREPSKYILTPTTAAVEAATTNFRHILVSPEVTKRKERLPDAILLCGSILVLNFGNT